MKIISKYTILHVSTKLEHKKGRMQKSETDADPPWGDGEQARKSLLKKYFLYYYWLQYQQTEILETSWSLYGMKPRSDNFPKF